MTVREATTVDVMQTTSSAPPAGPSNAEGRAPRGALAALTAAYCVSQFFRSFIAVIAPELSADLRLSPAELGILSSVYFGCSALAQVPLGIALDRLGAGRTVGLSLLLAAVSALGFSRAESFTVALVTHGALGMACAPLLMGLLYYVGQRYPPRRLVVISGVGGAVGLVGGLLAAAPFGWLSEAIGWRFALAIAASLTVVAGVAALKLVRDQGSTDGPVESPRQVLVNTLGVLRLRNLWPLIPICFVATGIALTFRTVWGGPYLARVFGLDTMARGTVLSMLGLGALSASVVTALVGRRFSPRALGLGASVAAVASLGLLACVPDVSPWVSGALLTVAAFFGAVHTPLMADGRSMLPARFAGRGLGVLNFFVYLGIGTINAAVGLIVQSLSADPVRAYRVVFVTLAVVLGAASTIYALGRRTKVD